MIWYPWMIDYKIWILGKIRRNDLKGNKCFFICQWKTGSILHLTEKKEKWNAQMKKFFDFSLI